MARRDRDAIVEARNVCLGLWRVGLGSGGNGVAKAIVRADGTYGATRSLDRSHARGGVI